MVAGEPLRRVGAPTPRLLRSPPLAHNEDCYDKKNLTQHYRRLPGFSRTTSST